MSFLMFCRRSSSGTSPFPLVEAPATWQHLGNILHFREHSRTFGDHLGNILHFREHSRTFGDHLGNILHFREHLGTFREHSGF
jgi:hypothetical protein